jgi:hypothetical protein
MSLGSDQFAETGLVKQETAGKIPFMMAYSGGEICPTRITKNQGENGEDSGSVTAINRFHNNTFVLCIF